MHTSTYVVYSFENPTKLNSNSDRTGAESTDRPTLHAPECPYMSTRERERVGRSRRQLPPPFASTVGALERRLDFSTSCTWKDMPSVSIVGQVLAATGFDADRVFCKYELTTTGSNWSAIYGDTDGQTQLGISTTNAEYSGHVFAHPIDVTYSASGLIGWPKLRLEVWVQDEFGRNQLGGYGMVHIPTTPGMHSIDVVTWRPEGSLLDTISTAFIGGNPMLVNPDIVVRSDDRMELNTVSCGTVHLDLQILLNGFKYKGVEFTRVANGYRNDNDRSEEVDPDEVFSVPLGQYIKKMPRE